MCNPADSSDYHEVAGEGEVEISCHHQYLANEYLSQQWELSTVLLQLTRNHQRDVKIRV